MGPPRADVPRRVVPVRPRRVRPAVVLRRTRCRQLERRPHQGKQLPRGARLSRCDCDGQDRDADERLVLRFGNRCVRRIRRRRRPPIRRCGGIHVDPPDSEIDCRGLWKRERRESPETDRDRYRRGEGAWRQSGSRRAFRHRREREDGRGKRRVDPRRVRRGDGRDGSVRRARRRVHRQDYRVRYAEGDIEGGGRAAPCARRQEGSHADRGSRGGGEARRR